MSFQKTLKKAKEIKKLVWISKLLKSSNCAEVEIEHDGTSCDYSSLQMANCKTCHHIVSVLLNLMQVGEGNQLVAQIEIEHAALMQMLSKVPTEILHHLSTMIMKT